MQLMNYSIDSYTRIMSTVYLFIIGTVMGSFICCAICRKDNLSSMWGRSECDTCHQQLQWFDLVPIFSYVLQGGKCRYCKSSIPLWTLLAEIMGGFSFLLFIYIPYYMGISVIFLFICAVFDLQYGEIPNWLSNTYLAYTSIVGVLYNGFKGVAAGIAVFVYLYIVYQMTDNKIGGADVKLLSACCMMYSAMTISVFFGIVAALACVISFCTKKPGVRLVPVMWIGYIAEYFINGYLSNIL